MTATRQKIKNATGLPLTNAMVNKLKRRKKGGGAACLEKDCPRAAEAMTAVSAEPRTSAGEAGPVKHGSDVAAAGFSPREVEEDRTPSGSGGLQIAPIFIQHAKNKRSSDWMFGQPLEKLQRPMFSPQCEREQRLSTVSHPSGRTFWSEALTPPALHCYLEEIQRCNPAFPVLAVFSALQRKTCPQDSESNPSSTHNHLQERRKRRDTSQERIPKRLRSGLSTEGSVMDHCNISEQGIEEGARKHPRSNKLSRVRQKQQSGSSAGMANNSESRSRECRRRLPASSDVNRKGSGFECVLWTDKYRPQRSSEVIGNSASVNKLHSWLKKWKLRAASDERRTEDRHPAEHTHDSWDCGDFQGEAGEDGDREAPLCKTMLITGPPGVGKTASVYACSQELGFKVFEVNCSSLRSGSHVLSQLKEATQSHLVDTSGRDQLKPAYFNNYSAAAKPQALPGKTLPLKNVTSTLKRRLAKGDRCCRSRALARPGAASLADYFKMTPKVDRSHISETSPSVKPETPGRCLPNDNPTVTCSTQTATSLVLFEEVDVIFDDDVGFLTAIKTFVTSSKRPVVLTTNDPSFKERFSCSVDEVIFRAPPVGVCSYLQLVGLAESVPLETWDILGLLRASGGDVRRCLLQLQLWVHSGGGRPSPRGRSPEEFTHVQDSDPPQYDTGCTASMLGLHPLNKSHLLNLLKWPFWAETDTTTLPGLLAESWRRRVPLLYSNLELLLTISSQGTSAFSSEKGTRSGSATQPTTSDIHIRELEGKVNPTVSLSDRKSVICRLNRRKYVRKNDPVSSCWTQSSKRTFLAETRSKAKSLSDKSEQKAAQVEGDCLDALADFLELMSYLDSTIPAPPSLVSGPCQPGAFVWTGSEIKDGMLDEMSEEDRDSAGKERLLEIQAAVEGLGCRRCLRRVSEAQKHKDLGDAGWTRLLSTLPAPSKTQRLSFGFQPACSQRRYKLSRRVLGSKGFGLLGNRNAVWVDYVPVLRYIGRVQRAQREEEEPVRGLDYFSRINLGLSRSTIQLLEEEFSQHRAQILITN